jgi:DNA invertase Pin-like site-specific DNA recombinase
VGSIKPSRFVLARRRGSSSAARRTTLHERGVQFRSRRENVDTTTASGKLTFHLFAALAEFERDLLRERTTAGLEAITAKRARGRRSCRPRKMTPEKIAVARQMHTSQAFTVEQIAATLGVTRGTVYAHLDRAGLGGREAVSD